MHSTLHCASPFFPRQESYQVTLMRRCLTLCLHLNCIWHSSCTMYYTNITTAWDKSCQLRVNIAVASDYTLHHIKISTLIYSLHLLNCFTTPINSDMFVLHKFSLPQNNNIVATTAGHCKQANWRKGHFNEASFQAQPIPFRLAAPRIPW